MNCASDPVAPLLHILPASHTSPSLSSPAFLSGTLVHRFPSELLRVPVSSELCFLLPLNSQLTPSSWPIPTELWD